MGCSVESLVQIIQLSCFLSADVVAVVILIFHFLFNRVSFAVSLPPQLCCHDFDFYNNFCIVTVLSINKKKEG